MQQFLILAVLMGAALTITTRDMLEEAFAERLAAAGAAVRGAGMMAMGYLGETRNAALKKVGEESTSFGVLRRPSRRVRASASSARTARGSRHCSG